MIKFTDEEAQAMYEDLKNQRRLNKMIHSSWSVTRLNLERQQEQATIAQQQIAKLQAEVRELRAYQDVYKESQQILRTADKARDDYNTLARKHEQLLAQLQTLTDNL